jgi:cytidylate kinase
MIITIDGPAGAGKSSVAKALAGRLGFHYLDTGAMYRAVTLAAHRAGVAAADEAALSHLLEGFQLDMPPGQVCVNGEDVTAAIRTPEVTAQTGAFADSPLVRKRLAQLQRQQAAGRDIICEGRDQGTVVFPEAACKFFLIASAAERARRRQQEMAQRGQAVSLDDVLAAQDLRDARDSTRQLAPMVPAADAIQLDSTGLTVDEVVTRMEAIVRLRINQP